MGITSVNDLYGAKIAPNPLDDLEIFKEFEREGLLTTRIHFSPELKMDVAAAKELQNNYQSDKLTFSGLKQFIDGVVTSHTAFFYWIITKTVLRQKAEPLIQLKQLNN
ncbi:hypothetical protein RCO48_36710 [Peribacillus frigoritolerans]|nr:hypothetical protein [Peribacillus frigoritolerans]